MCAQCLSDVTVRHLPSGIIELERTIPTPPDVMPTLLDMEPQLVSQLSLYAKRTYSTSGTIISGGVFPRHGAAHVWVRLRP